MYQTVLPSDGSPSILHLWIYRTICQGTDGFGVTRDNRVCTCPPLDIYFYMIVCVRLVLCTQMPPSAPMSDSLINLNSILHSDKGNLSQPSRIRLHLIKTWISDCKSLVTIYSTSHAPNSSTCSSSVILLLPLAPSLKIYEQHHISQRTLEYKMTSILIFSVRFQQEDLEQTTTTHEATFCVSRQPSTYKSVSSCFNDRSSCHVHACD